MAHSTRNRPACRCILALRMVFSLTEVLRQAQVRLRRQPLAVLGVVLLAVFVVCGLAAPWIAPYSPASINLLHRLEGPSVAHWAGTDELGRDTLARLLWGARLSLAVSVTVVAISLALGLADRRPRRLPRRMDRHRAHHLCHEHLSGAARHPAGHCLCRLSRSRLHQSGSRAGHWRMGRLRAPCPRAGDGGARTRIRRRRPRAGRQPVSASSSATYFPISCSRSWCRRPSAWRA